MRVEKIFSFFLIIISLVVGVFILKKEFLTTSFRQSNLLPNLLQEIKSRYLAIENAVKEIGLNATSNREYFFNLEESLFKEALTSKYLKDLTLEQRIGQLFIVGIEGTKVGPETEELIKNFYPGGILLLKKNIEEPEQLKKFINDLQTLSLRAGGLPLFIAVDQEGGVVDRIGFLKEKTAPSELETMENARQIGFNRGQELKELGVNLNLAPLLDESEPGDFIEQRSFQKEVAAIGDLASALISGQKKAGILTAIKHFPGYRGIRFNPEEKLAVLSQIPHISQFQQAMLGRPEFVMTANVIYQELDPLLPFTFSKTSIQFLKENLGEKALLISDDLAQNSLLSQFTLKEIITLPFLSGIDVLLFSGWRAPVEPAISAFREAVKAGIISEQEINQRVIKIIQFKTKWFVQLP